MKPDRRRNASLICSIPFDVSQHRLVTRRFSSIFSCTHPSGPCPVPVRYNRRYMFLGLEHTAIASPDPRKLAQWYVDNLGFHINFRYDQFFFVKAANGTMLEIIPSEGERGSNLPKDPGIRHLAIAVRDFDGAYQQLQKAGVKFLGEPYENQGNRLVFFSDGDGNILHLIARDKPLP